MHMYMSSSGRVTMSALPPPPNKVPSPWRDTSRRFPMVLDGAMGTELESLGQVIGDKPMWASSCLVTCDMPLRPTPTSMTVEPTTTTLHPVTRVHRSYADVGADIISTCTYQMSAAGARALNPSLTLDEVSRLAMRALSDAVVSTTTTANDGTTRSSSVLAVGSLGPYGSCLDNCEEFTGDYTLSVEEYQQFHQPRIDALWPYFRRRADHQEDSGSDFSAKVPLDAFAFETFPRADEALVVSSMASQRGAPHWISFTLSSSGHGVTTSSGDDYCEMVVRLLTQSLQQRQSQKVEKQEGEEGYYRDLPLVGVGCNCVAPSLATQWLRHLLLEANWVDVKGFSELQNMLRSSQEEDIADSKLNLVMYPNSGEEFVGGVDQPWVPGHASDTLPLSHHVKEWNAIVSQSWCRPAVQWSVDRWRLLPLHTQLHRRSR